MTLKGTSSIAVGHQKDSVKNSSIGILFRMRWARGKNQKK
jgi:hypothetical protein